MLLFAAKLPATSISLGSGSSGGAEAGHAVLTGDRHVVGVLDLDPPILRAIRNGGAETPLGDLIGDRFITVRAHEVSFDVIAMMDSRRAATAVMLEPQIDDEPDRVAGVITHHAIAASVADGIRLSDLTFMELPLDQDRPADNKGISHTSWAHTIWIVPMQGLVPAPSAA